MEFYYNLSGQLAAVMDDMGRMTDFDYYPFVENASGDFKANSGRLKRITDFSQRYAEYTYDLTSGDLLTVTLGSDNADDSAASSRTVRYTYSANSGTFSPANRLKAIIDDSGSRTSYEYDDQNRITKITYPDESFIEYTYGQVEAFNDGAGTINYYRTVTEKQRNGTVVTHYYDQLQRLMKREITPARGVEGTTEENYTYDGMSRVLTAANDSGTVEFDYDAAGRLKWEKQSGKLIEYTYDRVNNLRSIKYPNARLIERDFDNLNRMNLIKEGGVTLAQMTHIGRSYRLLNKQYGNGDVISYLYDQGRRLTHKETKNKNDVLINKYVYGYNKVHMRTFEQRGHDENKGDLYAYDELYRLTHVKFNSPEPDNPLTTQFEKQKTYNLDKLDNIISIIENQNDRTTEIQTTVPDGSNYQKLNQYEYFDTWGLTYDLNGNTTQKGGQLFTYDYRNQVVQARDDNKTVDFKYDAMGRRIEKTITTTSASNTNTTRFFYAGNQVIEERDDNDQVTKQFIFNNGIDEVLRVDLFSGGTSTPYYFHTNGNGSIVLITDADGNIIERITYDIYGMPTITDATGNVIATSTIGNEYLFHGRRYDREINLYYYRARYYDPIMGRFLQTDPMGYADSMNLYQGFNMNGINFVDPMGNIITFASNSSKKLFAEFEEKLNSGIGFRYDQIRENIKQLKESDIEFEINLKIVLPRKKSSSQQTGGVTALEGKKKKKVSVYIYHTKNRSYSKISRLAHELRHAYQFLTGELGYIRPKNRAKWLPSAYDIVDEVEAFDDQILFSTKSDFKDFSVGEILRKFRRAKNIEEKIAALGEFSSYKNLLIKYKTFKGKRLKMNRFQNSKIKETIIDNGKRILIEEEFAGGQKFFIIVNK